MQSNIEFVQFYRNLFFLNKMFLFLKLKLASLIYLNSKFVLFYIEMYLKTLFYIKIDIFQKIIVFLNFVVTSISFLDS